MNIESPELILAPNNMFSYYFHNDSKIVHFKGFLLLTGTFDCNRLSLH